MALQEISLDSTGRYACQVTLDAPPFLFVAKSGHMTVISLPERIPVISGLPKLKPHFNIGDRVNINCSCHNTFPPANLHWFINNKQVLLSQSAKGIVVTKVSSVQSLDFLRHRYKRKYFSGAQSTARFFRGCCLQ